MTFEEARELAQALAQRENMARGLKGLLRHDQPEDVVKQTMAQLANAYADAQDRIDELLRRDDEE